MTEPKRYDITKEGLEKLEKSELVDLLEMYAKNLVAMDGIWFQILEARDGMDLAMDVDAEVWNRFPLSEAGRLKRYYNMPEFPGLDGLEQALRVSYCGLANETSITREGNTLIYRTEVCRVQNARERKGMEFHPCKRVGVNEFNAFARAIDTRIKVECLSCFPDITDSTCSCSWKFTIPEDEA